MSTFVLPTLPKIPDMPEIKNYIDNNEIGNADSLLGSRMVIFVMTTPRMNGISGQAIIGKKIKPE